MEIGGSAIGPPPELLSLQRRMTILTRENTLGDFPRKLELERR
jgi:hypothetical protein